MGGIDIEEVAKEKPELLLKVHLIINDLFIKLYIIEIDINYGWREF